MLLQRRSLLACFRVFLFLSLLIVIHHSGKDTVTYALYLAHGAYFPAAAETHRCRSWVSAPQVEFHYAFSPDWQPEPAGRIFSWYEVGGRA